CVTNDDCTEETVCATHGERRWCATVCDESEDACLEGFECVDAEPARLCAPVKSLLGERCDSDAACLTGVCGVDGRCDRSCSSDSPCPTGFECRRGQDGAASCEVAAPPPGEGCQVTAVGAPARTFQLSFLLL